MHRATIFAALLMLSADSLALEPREVFKAADPTIVVIYTADAANKELRFGSGVIIAPHDVVTSCHVLEGAGRITVKQGNVQRAAKVRFQDSARDLCQISIDDSFPLGKPVSGYVMSGQLEVGQQVYAIGAPQGLEHTLSRGIVSALRATKESSALLIQTDAAVSPGSSGGGLFDAEARLIGLITFGFKEGQNLNFAIPADWIQELSARNRDRTSNSAVSGATGAQTVALDTRWSPNLGDRWRYRLLHNRASVGTVSVEIVDRGDGKVRERITREGSPGFVHEREVRADFTARAFLPSVNLPGGYQLFEFAPYFPPGSSLAPGTSLGQVPGEINIPATPRQPMMWKTRVVGLEKVRVPAGEFEAWRIESAAGRNTPWGSVKLTGNYWYSTAIQRTVKMTMYWDVSIGVNSTIEIYELTAFEPGK
jgi:hypothetical protein